MKSLQAGFTLIELMIVVAIIGILAAVAIPSYQDYVTRARVAEGLTMANSVKTVVTEFWITNNRWPDNATEAGLPPAASFQTDNVESITYATGSGEGDGATITITYTAASGVPADRNTIVLASDTSREGRIDFTCVDGNMDNRFRPANCRGSGGSDGGDGG